MEIEKYYEKLGLAANTPFKIVHSKYIELSKRYHPDGKVDLTDEERKVLEEKFKEISEAYNFIKNYSDKSLTGNFFQNKEAKAYSDKEIAKAYYVKGLQYLKEGDINNAIDSFMNAYRKDENNIHYLRYVVKALMEKDRRLYEAKEYCMKLIKLEDYNGENYFLLGKIYFKANLKDTARIYFEKAKKMGFESKELNSLLSQIQSENTLKNKLLSILKINKR